MQAAQHRKLRILAPGNWSVDQVSQSWAANSRRIVSEVESAIDAAWQLAMARPGVHLFDGPMCRLEAWQATEQQLRITLSKSTYKPFLGTNMAHPEFADTFGPDVMANPVGISPALQTSDGHLLLGHRTESVAYYPGRIHPFAGCLEPGDENLFTAVARELKEELSLGIHELTDIRCTGVAEDASLRQPELIFFAQSTRTRSEIEARLDPLEHHSIFSIHADSDSVEKVLAGEPRLTPVAVAALLLWGRLRLGENWFEKMVAAHAS